MIEEQLEEAIEILRDLIVDGCPHEKEVTCCEECYYCTEYATIQARNFLRKLGRIR